MWQSNRGEAKRRSDASKLALSSLIAICVICARDSAGFNIQFVQTFVESVESPCATSPHPCSPPVSCICILENCALTRQARFPILIPSLFLSFSLWGSIQGQVQPISECGSNRRCVATSAARSTQLPQRRNTSFILITIRLPKDEEQQQCQTTLSCIPISYIAIYNPKGQPLVCCALIEIATDAAVGDSPRISHFALVSQVSVDRAEVDN